MAEFLDLFSFWAFIVGAVAFVIVWAIAAAHRISNKEWLLIWRVAYFKWLVTVGVVSIGLSLIGGQVLKSIARREVSAILNSPESKTVFIYAGGQTILQYPDFILALKNLDDGESSGRRFGGGGYKMVLVSGRTITHFYLSRSSDDSTLHRVDYSKYSIIAAIYFVNSPNILLN